ncbi:MAG: hypothetical protein SangKO_043960 [Sandaracinaceae bacterium]
MEAGFGRADITVWERGMPMLGWGREDNVSLGVEAPLYARALAVRSAGRTAVYVCADLCFIAAGLRVAVEEALQETLGDRVHPADLLLTATHTHSGPAGYSHAFFYDLSGPGFSRRVFDGLVRGIVRAIEDAVAALAPARLRLATGFVPGAEPVAFNRSPGAHRRNRDAHAEDVDREMLVLDTGRGVISFFALHATSVHGDGTRLHPDHKGLACEAYEAARGVPAIFAQGAAGDVTPNYRWSEARGVTVGRHDDDLDSASYVADVQVRTAGVIAMTEGLRLDGPVGGALRRVDLERCPTTRGPTTIGRLGVAMAQGTAEGPGPLAPFAPLVRRFPGKATLLEIGPHRPRRLFGLLDPARLHLDHPAFAHTRRVSAAGGLDGQPWIPTILPVQLWRVGAFCIAALPNEPTTMVGRRLRARLEAALAPHGVRRVHVQGYANAYAGYLTTPEEYGAQRYEGAYTLFGPRSYEAFADSLEALVPDLLDEAPRESGPALQRCSPTQLKARAWRGP